MLERLTVAFGAGMLAVVNPCGFAMLPAYLSYFLGLDDPTEDARGGVIRALKVTAAVSAGFVAVFGVIGIALQVFALQIEEYLPYVTSVMGVVLVGLGIAMLFGFQPTFSLPHLERGGRSRELPSMALFGMSYAIASLSCTLPIFVLNVVNAFSGEGLAQGLLIYLAYAAGMAVLLGALTVTLALARKGLVTKLRSSLPYITRISGGLLVIAGAYLAYWGWYELQIYDGNLDAGGPAEIVQQWNSTVASWLDDVGPVRFGLLLAVGIAVVAAVAVWRSRRSPDDPTTTPTGPTSS